ncbi:DNA polymerase I [Mycobacterium phage Puhltonio]|uniref:DNA polymerase I n=1 Tax=Mycobacterium phage Puhltonio TaxID=663558 RepID=C9DCC9_9CAUD|nr:DNA polymerase I [Mycobacterium phage Puhltonio]
MTDILDTPVRVPSRSWSDPLLGARMHTGEHAVRFGAEFVRQAERGPANTIALATDIETPGLDNSFTINCVTMAWAQPDSGRVHSILLDPRRDEQHAALVAEMYALAGPVILHNAPFDIPPLFHAGLMTGEVIKKRIVDTVVLARFALPEPPPYGQAKTLTALAIRYLGLSEFKGGMERAFKAAGYKTQQAGYEGMDIDSPIYRQGAMADTVATLALEPVMRRRAIEWTLDHPFEVYGATSVAEAEAILDTQEIVHRMMLWRSALGINVDREYLDRYLNQVADEQAIYTADLAAHGLDGGTGKGAKLVQYLADLGELPQPWPRTPKGALRATKADLEYLAEINPLAKAQLSLANIEKTLGYLTKVSTQAAVTGRCHPQVATLGASATGRMSYGSPELQQFPKDARPILCDDGDGLTSIDWSQIEPVTMANMARDIDFLAAYEAGEDLYGPIMLAAGIDRPTSKVVLLSSMYGSGIAKLAALIGHTEESTAQIKRQMFAAMKRSAKWMVKVEEVAAQFGRVITAGGRILPVDEGGIFKAVNYTVQGSAYDVLANTIVEMYRRGMTDELYLAMHDEVVVSTPVAAEVQEIMSTPPEFLIRWAERTPVLRTDRADMGSQWLKV